MTTILLVRHAMCDPVGRTLAGRAPGVHLNPEGEAQAAALAARLAAERIDAVYASPLERARETAARIAAPHGLEVREAAGLVEIDYGCWTGRAIHELRDDPAFHTFNASRSSARIPGGETMREAQVRALAALREIAARHRGGTVVAVTHGDIVRAILLHAAGRSLNEIHALDVAPASVHRVEVAPS